MSPAEHAVTYYKQYISERRIHTAQFFAHRFKLKNEEKGEKSRNKF